MDTLNNRRKLLQEEGITLSEESIRDFAKAYRDAVFQGSGVVAYIDGRAEHIKDEDFRRK